MRTRRSQRWQAISSIVSLPCSSPSVIDPRPPDMTPRKDETPEEFRARQRAQYAVADPEHQERRLARQRERRRHRYARLILCTANSY